MFEVLSDKQIEWNIYIFNMDCFYIHDTQKYGLLLEITTMKVKSVKSSKLNIIGDLVNLL